jgi:hypothetical protein
MRAPPTLAFVALVACGLAIDCGGSFSTEAGQAAGADAGGGLGTGTGGSENAAGGTSGTSGAGGSSGATASGGVGTGSVGTGGLPPLPESGVPKPLDIELSISDDRDDATWIGGDDERLSYRPDQPFDEVGADSEMGRAAFRFELPIPPNSVIESAELRLNHTEGSADETETMLVQVYDSASVPPFDGDHVHAPSDHTPGGLWPVVVSGFAVGLGGSEIRSPDLTVLVQHVIDRSDWISGGSIAFVLSPDTLTTWVGFADRASGSDGARLRVTYTPPFR